jgi:excisionase family DNA binding protein
MADPINSPSLLDEAFVHAIRRAVREELQSFRNETTGQLLTPEELAAKLSVPRSWVYENSRQNKIPVHRIGRYIRFNLKEVLDSQKNK